LQVTSDVNDGGLPWAIGAVYDTLSGRMTITADDATVAKGSFGLLDTELKLAGAFQGYAVTARCRRLRNTYVHYGATSVECEVSVAGRTDASPVRSVRLGPGADREAVAALLDSSSSTSVAVYDPATGQITVTIDGTVVAEGIFPPSATGLELRGQHRDHGVTALCVRAQASGMAHDSVRCTVTDEEAIAEAGASSTAVDVPAQVQPASGPPATAQQATVQPAVAQPTPVRAGAAQLAPIQSVAAQPTPPQPAAPKPAAGQPDAAQRTAAQPAPPEPATAQPAMTQSTAAQPAATQPATRQLAAARATLLRPCAGPQCIHIEPQTYHLATSPDTAWVIAGDYDSLSNRLTLTVNGAAVAQGRFGLFDTQLQITNVYEGHKISASCTKTHGGASLASSALKCTVFVDQERAVELRRET
jgi:hypothetical protein